MRYPCCETRLNKGYGFFCCQPGCQGDGWSWLCCWHVPCGDGALLLQERLPRVAQGVARNDAIQVRTEVPRDEPPGGVQANSAAVVAAFPAGACEAPSYELIGAVAFCCLSCS